MAGLMLCLLLSALDNSIVGTAMPKIIGDLQGLHLYSLPFTAYLLFSTVVIPVVGKLSDVYGRKIVALWGIALFMVSSALCGLSVDMPMLIVFRGLQGASGGALASSSFIICSELFPPQQRGKYIGMLISMYGLANVLGPIVGGLLTDYLSWHWIFYINIPVGLVSFALLKKYLPLIKHPQSANRLDFEGISFFLLSLFPLLFCFAEGGKLLPWRSPLTIGLFVFTAIMLLLFIRTERKSHSPLLPVAMLQHKVFKRSALSAAMGYVALFGLILYLPYFLQLKLHRSASFTGMVMMPMCLAMVAGSMASGMLASRWLKLALMGKIAFCLALVGFVPMLIFGESISIPLLIGAVVIVGLGIGINFPVMNMIPQAYFPVAVMGILVSSIEFFQVMGGVVSSSVFGNMLHGSPQWIIILSMVAMAVGFVAMTGINDGEIRRLFGERSKPENGL